jgi:hypothetical protein
MSRLDRTRQADRAVAAPRPLDEPDRQPRVFRSPKILDLHLDRLAVDYVRQSDPHQVLNNRE